MTPRPGRLGKKRAFDPTRSLTRREELAAIWQEVKLEILLYYTGKNKKLPAFKSYTDLEAHLGARPVGAVIVKSSKDIPHGPSNTCWLLPDGSKQGLKTRPVKPKMVSRPKMAVGRPREEKKPRAKPIFE